MMSNDMSLPDGPVVVALLGDEPASRVAHLVDEGVAQPVAAVQDFRRQLDAAKIVDGA